MTMATIGSTDNKDVYFNRMLSSLGDKKRVFDYLKVSNTNGTDQNTAVVDVGCGDGSLVKALNSGGFSAVGVDASVDSVSRAVELGVDVLSGYADEIGGLFSDALVDNIVCSAVMHEVFSYGNKNTGYQVGRIQNVVDALDSMHQALKSGGRLIIRDGISPVDQYSWIDDKYPSGLVEFRAPEALVKKFLTDSPFSIFNVAEEDVDRRVSIMKGNSEGAFMASPSSMLELAFTATWGENSWEREINEFYGIFTGEELTTLAETIGFELVHFENYVQPGYIDGVANAGIEIIERDMNGDKAPFPYTNAIWVFEKK